MKKSESNKQIMMCRGRAFHWGMRTYVMGVINMTPNSFSGDGLTDSPETALQKALKFEALGADFIDVGAESTRPGYTPISSAVELARLLPALDLIAPRVGIPLSVDTRKSEVAEQALEAGASIINDIWGLKQDPAIANVAYQHHAPLILMHNQSTTEYRDLIPDVVQSLSESINLALCMGVPNENIIVDPGIGFGKNPDHNLDIIRRLADFNVLGHPILIGTSRKSTIGMILGLPVDQRLLGTAATVALAIAGGADIVRVHDVEEMVLVARMSDAVIKGWRPQGWTI